MIETQTIPLVDLKAQYRSIKTDVMAAIESILDGMQLFLGENVVGFEREFADFCGVSDCVGVATGTDALFLALRACGVGPGDEVITVSNTFIATVEAILLAGATPVLVDVDHDTLTIDPRAVAEHVTPRTKAVIPVHLYGRLADMDGINEVARRHGLAVVEDACQAHGATRGGKRAGSFGNAGCFSSYFSKNLGAYGEAGAVVTNDNKIADRVRQLRNHGSTARYYHAEFGTNSRLDEIQAVVLRIKLRHLDRWNNDRRAIAATYDRQLADSGVKPLPAGNGEDHAYHLYVVRTELRDWLRPRLDAVGISTAIHYPVPIHLQPAWATLGLPAVHLPVTEAAANHILSLPMYPELSESHISYICDQVARAMSGELSPGTSAAEPNRVDWRRGPAQPQTA